MLFVLFGAAFACTFCLYVTHAISCVYVCLFVLSLEHPQPNIMRGTRTTHRNLDVISDTPPLLSLTSLLLCPPHPTASTSISSAQHHQQLNAHQLVSSLVATRRARVDVVVVVIVCCYFCAFKLPLLWPCILNVRRFSLFAQMMDGRTDKPDSQSQACMFATTTTTTHNRPFRLRAMQRGERSPHAGAQFFALKINCKTLVEGITFAE